MSEQITKTEPGAGMSADAKRRFEQRKAWFSMEMRRQEANRYQMALDEDYYDSIQWQPDEAAAVRRRGQNPIVYNEIKPTIDWLIGTERRMRRDFKVLSRVSDAEDATADAEVKTSLLKYLADVNRTPFERSTAFKDAMRAGLGWLEVGVRADPEDEPIYTQAESWRNIVHDSIGLQKLDLTGCRYLFRFREIDLDVAQAFFPNKKAALERAADADESGMFGNGWFNGWPIGGLMGSAQMPAKWIQYDADSWLFNPRKRVLLIECWSYEPTRETTGRGAGMDRVRMKMHCSVMTEHETIIEGPSPYKHNRFPFIPLWAYRRAKDGMPYSPIRSLRGPQDDLNKRMSKATFLLSINQVRAEKSAIDKEVMDIDELREELASPDGIALFADGALSGNRVQVRENADLAQGHIVMAEKDAESIRQISGVSGENRSLETNAQSGKAIIAKQTQGSMLTAELFDEMLRAHQIEGELTLSLIEQYYTEPKVFSVTGERFKVDYTKINQIDPATGQKVNDVTAHQASFVIGEAPWRQALAESAFESALELLGKLAPAVPQVVIAIIDLVFEWSDMPNKQEILQRIRAVTGQSDPDKGDTPEQQAAKAQKAQLAQAEFEAQLAGLRASVAEAEAKGEKLSAEAMAKRLEALTIAAQGAAVIAANPAITPVADELLKSAGYEDRSAPQVLDMAPPDPSAPPMNDPAALPPPEGAPVAAPPMPVDGGIPQE
jgi:hypothetical protein